MVGVTHRDALSPEGTATGSKPCESRRLTGRAVVPESNDTPMTKTQTKNSLVGRTGRCDRCGREHDEKALDVRPRHLPSEGQEILCHECWASAVADVSTLTERQAELATLLSIDEYSHGDIAEIVGMGRGNVSTYKSRLREKAEKARAEMEQNERTLEVIGGDF